MAEKAEGRPYDHVQKVLDAMTGVIGLTEALTRRLSYPGLNDADRQRATDLLSEASRKIEEVRRMVPGIDQRRGDYK